MINLIKNELTKIFHKKAIYIVLVITLAFTVLNCILGKIFFDDASYFYEDTESIKESMNSLDRSNPEDNEIYVSLAAELQSIELSKKYEDSSWQNYIIFYKGQDIIADMIRAEGTPEYAIYKRAYDNFLQKLENDNWKTFAQEELDEINSKIAELESLSEDGQSETSLISLRDSKQALEWRLEKNIAYGNTARSNVLEEWATAKVELRDFAEQEKTKKLTYSQQREKQQLEGNIKLYEYAIENDIDDKYELTQINDQTAFASSVDDELVENHYEYSIFIIIAVVIIAGTTISEESNKGTIKLLLVKPYKRTKILVAKFISCFIVLLTFYIATTLFQGIVGGCVYGFNNYLGKVITYNFNTGTVETISTFKYLLLTGIAIMPYFLLIMTLAFAISTIANNSPTAIAIPLLGTMAAGIINQLAIYHKKAQFLKYFVTPNWDLRIYLFGRLSEFEPISLPFSIAICLIYFLVMVVASIYVFRKRDIKNV